MIVAVLVNKKPRRRVFSGFCRKEKRARDLVVEKQSDDKPLNKEVVRIIDFFLFFGLFYAM